MRFKPFHEMKDSEPLPVKQYVPNDRQDQPADLQTVAVVLLRKNRKLYDKPTKEGKKCLSYLYHSGGRQLTIDEAKHALALIAALKEYQ